MPLFKKTPNDLPTSTTATSAGQGTGANFGPGPGYDMAQPIPGSNAGPTQPHGQPHSYGQPHLGTGMTTGVQSGQAGYHNAFGPPPDQIPSSSAIGTNQQGAGQHAMTGKVEHAVGAMIGSKSLKAKGIQKEQEAQAYKVQSQELGEAERLEREALMRRQRAVAHGAHPDHRHLGGNAPGMNQADGF